MIVIVKTGEFSVCLVNERSLINQTRSIGDSPFRQVGCNGRCMKSVTGLSVGSHELFGA